MALKLNELNFENIDEWPIVIRTACVVVIFGIISFLGYWFLIESSMGKLAIYEKKENKLKNDLKISINKTANLPEYINQMKQLDAMFLNLLNQLPNQKEIPALLEDITSVGLKAGLTFNLIRPSTGKRKDFYEIIEIEIEVEGTYDQLGEFAEGIAALSRIVTIQDFTVNVVSDNKDKNIADKKLIMRISANTYRYLSLAEQKIQAEEKQKAKMR